MRAHVLCWQHSALVSQARVSFFFCTLCPQRCADSTTHTSVGPIASTVTPQQTRVSALYLLEKGSDGVGRLLQRCSDQAMKRAMAQGKAKERCRPTSTRTSGSAAGLDRMLHLAWRMPVRPGERVHPCWVWSSGK